jgi:hypothetical protein
MAYKVCYVLGSTDPIERALALGKVLRALCRINIDYLRHHPEVPSVATARIRVVPEPRDIDAWFDVPTLLRKGRGTLPELRCWQAAEAFVRGKQALVVPVLDTIDDEQGRFTLGVDLFKGEEERQLSHRALSHMLVALAEIDAILLRRHPEWPNLYDSGVRYEEEPVGQEDWQDAPSSMALGIADCEDLACWRTAELNVRCGIQARPSFIWRKKPNGSYLYHIQTKHPDGRIEDPSRRLGMR